MHKGRIYVPAWVSKSVVSKCCVVIGNSASSTSLQSIKLKHEQFSRSSTIMKKLPKSKRFVRKFVEGVLFSFFGFSILGGQQRAWKSRAKFERSAYQFDHSTRNPSARTNCSCSEAQRHKNHIFFWFYLPNPAVTRMHVTIMTLRNLGHPKCKNGDFAK